MRRLPWSGSAKRVAGLLCLVVLGSTGGVAAQQTHDVRFTSVLGLTPHKPAPMDQRSEVRGQRSEGVTTHHSPLTTHHVRSGWLQVVRFESPAGASVEIASSSGVVQLAVPAQVALVHGQTYRLRVSNVGVQGPEKPGLTFFPTIRLIGYIMPPANVDPLEFPIPVHFLMRDFDEASSGRLVSNIVYLEDPQSALPLALPPGELPVIDARPGEDPFTRASRVGRPILYIQLGNRVPVDDRFEDPHGDPPVFIVPATVETHAGDSASSIETANWQSRRAGNPGAPGFILGLLSRPSAQACSPSQPVVRLPYKVHPRMPRDESLPDGGDQVPYAHFTGYDQVTGLGAGETVAQFSRPGDRPRLVASNQVAVYAPRFGLVRSSLVSVGNLHMVGSRGVDHQLRRGSIESRTSAEYRAQEDHARSVRGREQLSSVARSEPLGGLDELRVIAAVVKEEGYDKVFGHIGPNAAVQADELRIAGAIEAARTWNRPQYPAYTAITEGGGQITGYMRNGEVQQIKEPYRKPGDLLLWKTVTPHSAKQGDIVEFAIYYRNTGQRPIESVSIIDSLTARLEYVPDSAQTDRRAVFTAAPNDVESQELRWDISDSIPGGQGGVVWFQAKVR